jgi:hypothetical protein
MVTGWGQVQPEKQAVDGNDPHGGHAYISVGDTALFRGEELLQQYNFFITVKTVFNVLKF